MRQSAVTGKEIRDTLFQDMLAATARSNEAMRRFDEIMGQSSGLPQAHGAQGIRDASEQLALARQELATAHHRLDEYLNRGIVPEAVKPTGGVSGSIH